MKSREKAEVLTIQSPSICQLKVCASIRPRGQSARCRRNPTIGAGNPQLMQGRLKRAATDCKGVQVGVLLGPCLGQEEAASSLVMAWCYRSPSQTSRGGWWKGCCFIGGRRAGGAQGGSSLFLTPASPLGYILILLIIWGVGRKKETNKTKNPSLFGPLVNPTRAWEDMASKRGLRSPTSTRAPSGAQGAPSPSRQ